jgi:lipopolysaccharide transport system permease protein
MVPGLPMMQVFKEVYAYRELLAVLAWKNVIVRYKQAYLGLLWTILKPILMVLMFSVVRSFVGIDTGHIPYAVLTFGALLPWVYFQETSSDGINSVVANAALVKKIYFPREIFPLASILTKLVELGINFLILAVLMLYYQLAPAIHIVWVPLIIFYTILVSLCISMAGAAMNVYYRDIATALPVVLSFFMYLSPIIYPLSLVKKTLLINQAAGEWSQALFTLYTLNPLVGIIDAFQKAMFYGESPDFSVIWPGLVIVVVALPLSYMVFKRAEAYFADVI